MEAAASIQTDRRRGGRAARAIYINADYVGTTIANRRHLNRAK